MAGCLPNKGTVTLPSSGVGMDRFAALNEVLTQCVVAARSVSEQISTTYFTHSLISSQSVGPR